MTPEEQAALSESNRRDFIERLKTVSESDALWHGLIWLIESNKQIEERALCAPSIGDEAAHRSRGRLSAWLDMGDLLEEALSQSRLLDKGTKSAG